MDQAREYNLAVGMYLLRNLLQPLGSVYLPVDRFALVQQSTQTVRSLKLDHVLYAAWRLFSVIYITVSACCMLVMLMLCEALLLPAWFWTKVLCGRSCWLWRAYLLSLTALGGQSPLYPLSGF